MKNFMYLLIVAGIYLAAGCNGDHSVVAKDAELVKLAGGFAFTEGPAVDKQGNVYFTDIPNNRIHIWTKDGRLETFMENSGGANGLYFDGEGNLIACAGNDRRVVRIDDDKKVRVLADRYEGKKLNKPNDLWIDPQGGIYFTDPAFGGEIKMEQDGQHVYYIGPDRKKVIRVIDDLVKPNGIIGTPDGKKLYVADYGGQKSWVYKINPDATLTDKKLFARQGSDGMTIDRRGNVYLTWPRGKNITVYNREGIKIEYIDLPERPANLTFGGPHNQTLYITASTSLYSLKMNTKGN